MGAAIRDDLRERSDHRPIMMSFIHDSARVPREIARRTLKGWRPVDTPEHAAIAGRFKTSLGDKPSVNHIQKCLVAESTKLLLDLPPRRYDEHKRRCELMIDDLKDRLDATLDVDERGIRGRGKRP